SAAPSEGRAGFARASVLLRHDLWTASQAMPRRRGSGDRHRLAGPLLRQELALVQLGVQAAASEERRMVAALDEMAAVEDEDQVGGEDRREPVRDRDRGAVRE